MTDKFKKFMNIWEIEYHQHLMAKLIDENTVSRKVNNFLKSHSQKQIQRISSLTSDQFRAPWDEEKSAGNVGREADVLISSLKQKVARLESKLHITESRLVREEKKNQRSQMQLVSIKNENTANNIEAMIKRSDVVICPVNCNSHNACYQVKRLCNRHNKTLKILNSSSLSAVKSALFDPAQEAVLN